MKGIGNRGGIAGGIWMWKFGPSYLEERIKQLEARQELQDRYIQTLERPRKVTINGNDRAGTEGQPSKR